jgi:class 3 adenylate cyclase
LPLVRVDVAELQAAGLYDPDAPNAADRLALLEWILDHGIAVEEIAATACSDGSLTGIVADRVVRPGARLTFEEAAARSDITVEQARQIVQASGSPPAAPEEQVFTEADVDSFFVFRFAADMFGWPATLQFTRVMGASLARIAEAAVSLFQVNVESRIVGDAAGELALAQANLEATRGIDGVVTVLGTLFRQHVEAATQWSRSARAVGQPLGTARLAVGFVDLVGFTPLSLELDVTGLAALVEDFEARAADVVVAHHGRVVKLIGDEVMFAAVDPGLACEIALALVDEFRDSDAVTPRGGLAYGVVVSRGGDYYGPIVNVAARVAQLAVPDEILVTDDVARAAGASFCFEPAGRRMLKGFDDPVQLFVAGRAPDVRR